MKSGWRGAHKGKTRFDPHDFGVDLYVVVDQETYDNIAAAYPELDNGGVKIMPRRTRPPDLVALADEIGRAFKEQFPNMHTESRTPRSHCVRISLGDPITIRLRAEALFC
jgi:hypothetical protein